MNVIRVSNSLYTDPDQTIHNLDQTVCKAYQQNTQTLLKLNRNNNMLFATSMTSKGSNQPDWVLYFVRPGLAQNICKAEDMNMAK